MITIKTWLKLRAGKVSEQRDRVATTTTAASETLKNTDSHIHHEIFYFRSFSTTILLCMHMFLGGSHKTTRGNYTELQEGGTPSPKFSGITPFRNVIYRRSKRMKMYTSPSLAPYFPGEFSGNEKSIFMHTNMGE